MSEPLEIINHKLDVLTDAQRNSISRTDKLTEAVTELIVQTKNFEKLRSEDHHRMDKIESSVIHLREDVFTKTDSLENKIALNTSRIDESKPILAIISALILAVLIALVTMNK